MCAFAVGSHYRLQVSDVLWSCVCRCWAEHVYLPPLAHRFWKLTLQLLSRYATFLTEVKQIKAFPLKFYSLHNSQLYGCYNMSADFTW